MNTLLRLVFACLFAFVATSVAAPRTGLSHLNGNEKSRVRKNPGRVVTKTYTYDSTRDPYDPCNPVTGDHQKCIASMADDVYPTYNPPTGDFVTEAEHANAFAAGHGTDYDVIYSRPPKTSEMKQEQGRLYQPVAH